MIYIKIEKDIAGGQYIKDGERYNIFYGHNIAFGINDEKNWLQITEEELENILSQYEQN